MDKGRHNSEIDISFLEGECGAFVKSLIDEIDDTVYFKDIDSRFLMVNKALLKKHSMEKEDEILGKTDFDVFTKEHAQQAFDDEQKVIETREPIKGAEEKETWPDGSVTWVSTSRMPLYDGKGEIVGTCGISRDITERVMNELRLMKAQKLESLGLLAGGIAHDFNNLITMIRCHLELALDDLGAGSVGEKMLKDVWPVLDRAAELTDHLLMFAGRRPAKLAPVVISDVVKKTAKLVQSSVPENIIIESEVDDEVFPINCDVVQIEQIVMNLVRNSVESIMGDKGRVTVRVYNRNCDAGLLANVQSIDLLKPGQYVCLEVQDDGCGMDVDTIARVFDPFYTTKEKGKGMGLAMIMGVINSHKGGIEISSAPGRGSQFTLLFPATIF